MVAFAPQDNFVQSRPKLLKTVQPVHTLMEKVINHRINATFVQMDMFVQQLVRVTILCLQHHVQQVDGVVLEFHQIQRRRFVMLDINVQWDQRCKYLVLLVNTIQVLVLHNQHVQLARQETIASSGTPSPRVKLPKN
jgi:hypothetical protein